MVNIATTEELTNLSTPELKNQILELVKGRDVESIKAKCDFYKNQLAPYVSELSRRNPFPLVSEQLSIVLGFWKSVWSTIPFQDILPGRINDQSYQIFHDDGYYANIARFAPGYQSKFWRIFTSILPAYDLMVLQKYGIKDEQWFIQNVGIFQGLNKRGKPLTVEEADDWFTKIVTTKFQGDTTTIDLREEVKLDKMDSSTVKKFEKAYLAIPQLEHLYIDDDFRLIKSQREAKQRPSYTIAVRDH
ncbi:hypothetical protein VB711_08075 [Cronbergia sp. UHCC 0137]|uniref:hypothetical protein n=1 Tax=Cronbergia sp. UHCC 0137 TaxID=3110239 RepID=UPI002B2094FE|nr:hypothetical protein [Cronbergia sp. UHCC 0137]MEA5617794.1 hypothetical protein [Cronbergia sp. UHCC 0137]